MKGLANILLAATAIALAGLCLARQRELSALRAGLAELRGRQAAARPLAQSPKPVLPEAPPAGAAAPAPVVTNAPAPAAPKPIRVKSRPREEFLRMLNDPKRKEFMEAAWTLELDQRYGPLLRYYELTPEEMGYFRSLLLEKRSRADGGTTRLLAAGDDAAQRAAAQEARDQTLREVDGRLRDFLGGGAFEEYGGYEKSLPERMMLHDFKIVLDNSGDRLGYEQEDKLIRLMYEERAAVPDLSELYENEGRPAAIGSDRGLEIIRAVNVWRDRVLLRAGDLLDKRQMYFFEGQVQQIRDVIEVSITMAPLVMESE